ncbi:MAG: alginate export family protein, partial [Candidatus Marinimicrobia bacterium]|nr:alginate export family protein [Candidatus Neomarinimicrobiota bacterium]
KEVENSDFGDTGDKNVIGAYGDFELIKNHTTQAFLIWQRTEPTSELSRFTAGFYARGKINNFFHETEFAYQGGEISNIDVSAYMAALNIGYTFAGQKIAPTVAVGIDYLSGDDDLSDDTFKTFNTLYATNHKYYGFMDYFINIPVHTQKAGLQDIITTVSVALLKNLHAKLDYHLFSTAQEVFGETAIGMELDLTVTYGFRKGIKLVGGYSSFTPDKVFENWKGSAPASWAYLMTIFNF